MINALPPATSLARHLWHLRHLWEQPSYSIVSSAQRHTEDVWDREESGCKLLPLLSFHFPQSQHDQKNMAHDNQAQVHPATMYSKRISNVCSGEGECEGKEGQTCSFCRLSLVNCNSTTSSSSRYFFPVLINKGLFLTWSHYTVKTRVKNDHTFSPSLFQR